MEGFVVTCPLASATSHLISSSCPSSRSFALGFLQTLPRDNALALSLSFGSAITWYRDFHPTSLVGHAQSSVTKLIVFQLYIQLYI